MPRMPPTGRSGISGGARKQHSAAEKIQIVLAGLRGEESIAALCRRGGIAESLYYSWSKEFLEVDAERTLVHHSKRLMVTFGIIWQEHARAEVNQGGAEYSQRTDGV